MYDFISAKIKYKYSIIVRPNFGLLFILHEGRGFTDRHRTYQVLHIISLDATYILDEKAPLNVLRAK
jgi:hypothetical protein